MTETNAGLTSTGTLTVTDLDRTDSVTASVDSLAATGTGSGSVPTSLTNTTLKSYLSVSPTAILDNTETSATLTWDFNSGSEAFNFLAKDETLILTYTVKATDDDGTPLSDTETVTVTITGTNDGPDVSVESGDSVAATLTETNTTLTATDTLTVSDSDLTDVVSSTVTGVVASSTTAGLGSDNAALLAMFTSTANVLDNTELTDTLTWAFDSDAEAFDYLATGESLTLTYTITVTDSQGATDTQDVVITINGTSDAPVITDGPDSVALTETDAGLTGTGTLTVTDLDRTDNVTASVDSLAASGTGSGSVPTALTNTTLKSYLSVSPTAILDNTETSATLTWDFNSGSEAFNFLAKDETLVLTYTVKATDDDGTPLSDTETVTVTITGTNDGPDVSIETGDSASETLTETNTTLTATDTLTVSDSDLTDVVSSTVTGVVASSTTAGLGSDNAALLAMFTSTPNVLDSTELTDTLTWAFDSDSESFDYLANGESLTLTYTITVTDSEGATDTQTVVITINGTNDAPEVTGPATATVAESGSLTFDTVGAGLIDSFDIDNDNLTVTLTANHASIALAQTTGLTLVDGDGSDGTLQFSGSQANIDAALDGLDYDSQAGYNGAATLVALVDDGSLTDSITFAITVTSGQTTFVWDGGGTTDDWSDALNWDHDLVPEANDIVVFNATSIKDSDIDSAFAGSVSEIQVSPGYTGIITQASDFHVTGDFAQTDGTFRTAGFLLDVDGDVNRPGGSISFGSSRIEVGGDFNSTGAHGSGSSLLVLDGSGDQTYTKSGSIFSFEIANTGGTVTFASELGLFGDFTHTSGTVDFNDNRVSLNGTTGQTVDASGLDFDDFRINNATGTIAITGGLDIDGDLTVNTASNISGQDLTVAGDVTINDSSWTGSSAIILDGTLNQTVTGVSGYNVSHLTINKASGTATLDGDMSLRGNLLHTTGTVDASTLDLNITGSNNGMVHGSIGPINTLTLSNNGIRNFSGDLQVNDQFSINNSGTLTGGSIVALGDIALSDTFYVGTTTIEIGGSADQTVTAASSSALLRNAIINKTGGTVTFANDHRITGSLTHTAGNSDFTGVTTDFEGSGLVLDTDGSHSVTSNSATIRRCRSPAT